MSEYATTTLSLTPVTGTWQEVRSRVDAFLREQHKPPSSLPKQGRLRMVDTAQRRIVRLRPVDLSLAIDAEPAGIEYWRSVSVRGLFDATAASVRFSWREAGNGLCWVDVRFSTPAHESVYCFDKSKRDFNPRAKADLLSTFIAVAKTLEAAGFGYRMVDEDNLFGPLSIDSLRDYIEVGNRWFQNKLQLLVAGLAVPCVNQANFEYDSDSDQPLHYRQEGFYIYDLLWPG